MSHMKAYKILRSYSLDGLEVKILENLGDKWILYGSVTPTTIRTEVGSDGATEYVTEYSQAMYRSQYD